MSFQTTSIDIYNYFIMAGLHLVWGAIIYYTLLPNKVSLLHSKCPLVILIISYVVGFLESSDLLDTLPLTNVT